MVDIIFLKKKSNLYIDINNVIRHDVCFVLSFRSEISWQALITLIRRQKSGPLVIVWNCANPIICSGQNC